jgi:hypothetical protein
MAQRGLADTGIAPDQGESGEAARALPDLLVQAGKRLERRLLRHAQIEADPIGQRTVIDRFACGRPVSSAPDRHLPIASRHNVPPKSRPARPPVIN